MQAWMNRARRSRVGQALQVGFVAASVWLVWPDRGDPAPPGDARQPAVPRGAMRANSDSVNAGATFATIDAGTWQRNPEEHAVEFARDPFSLPAPRVLAARVEAAAPPTVSKPALPTLPFMYLGTISDVAGRRLLLADGDVVHAVGAGERIDARYRLAAADAGKATFEHLPSGERQTLSLPTGN